MRGFYCEPSEMPVLSNPKHEMFAQYLAQGDSVQVAAGKAGYSSTTQVQASRLKRMTTIRNRVKELQEAAADEAIFTVEQHLEKLAELRDDAHAAGKYSAAITAEVSRGKCAGFYIERTQVELSSTSHEDLVAELVNMTKEQNETQAPTRH